MKENLRSGTGERNHKKAKMNQARKWKKKSFPINPKQKSIWQNNKNNFWRWITMELDWCPWPNDSKSHCNVFHRDSSANGTKRSTLSCKMSPRNIYRSRSISRRLDWQCVSRTRHRWRLIVLRLLIRHWILLLVQISIVVNRWVWRILLIFDICAKEIWMWMKGEENCKTC